VERFDGAFDPLRIITNVVGIVDDNDIGTATGEAAAEGGHEDAAARCGAEVGDLGMALLNPGPEHFLEPARLQD
jgi:hypothetical protein